MSGKKHPEKKRADHAVESRAESPDRPARRAGRPEGAPSAAGQTAPAERGERHEEPEADVGRLRSELEAARAKAAEDLDKFLRAKAEADNARRRAEIDVAHARKYGIERFAAEMLAVRDSLELARTVDIELENQSALAKMHEGLDLTLKLMDNVFEKFSLKVIDPIHEKFDPEKHQAISMVESNEVPPGHVVQVVQKGYMLYDRLLRPAMVMVAKAPAERGQGNSP
jgi:molecular chaperone GrpE